MTYILISNTTNQKINLDNLNFVSNEIQKLFNAKVQYNELSLNKAYEWDLPTNDIPNKILSFITNLKAQNNFDANIIKSKNKRKKELLLADMDSTIIQEESLDELAKMIGKDKEITQITKEAMEGKIDFKKALIERVSMLQGVSFEILERLQENIKINDGAKELIKTMKHNGAITVLVSGGFTFLTDYLKKILDFDFTHANSLQYFVNNQNKKILNGRVNEPILDNQAKLNYLNDYLNKNNLSPEDSICVGDGANDIDMIIKSGMGVAFNGKKALNQIADLHFKHTNLLGLLYAQGYSDKEINSTK